MAPLGAARIQPGQPILAVPSCCRLRRGPQGGLLVPRRGQDTSQWLACSFWAPHAGYLAYFCPEEGVGRLEKGAATMMVMQKPSR